MLDKSVETDSFTLKSLFRKYFKFGRKEDLKEIYDDHVVDNNLSYEQSIEEAADIYTFEDRAHNDQIGFAVYDDAVSLWRHGVEPSNLGSVQSPGQINSDIDQLVNPEDSSSNYSTSPVSPEALMIPYREAENTFSLENVMQIFDAIN